MEAEKFARRTFRWAAVYGAIVLTPLLLQPTPAGARIEINLGFIGLALVFQGVFWTIGGDPLRYRALMPPMVQKTPWKTSARPRNPRLISTRAPAGVGCNRSGVSTIAP